jgi:predicted RNase H-like nuclease (RuvC/YqgF family)
MIDEAERIRREVFELELVDAVFRDEIRKKLEEVTRLRQKRKPTVERLNELKRDAKRLGRQITPSGKMARIRAEAFQRRIRCLRCVLKSGSFVTAASELGCSPGRVRTLARGAVSWIIRRTRARGGEHGHDFDKFSLGRDGSRWVLLVTEGEAGLRLATPDEIQSYFRYLDELAAAEVRWI